MSDTSITYHGHVQDCAVSVVVTGEHKWPYGHVHPLPHVVKHSSTGFSWGYGGSGPADLARSLLVHALDGAVCTTCDGTGQTVYGEDGVEMSVSNAESLFEGGEWAEHVYTCTSCEDGIAVPRALYQQFKWDVIAKLPIDRDWELSRDDVLQWTSGQEASRV